MDGRIRGLTWAFYNRSVPETNNLVVAAATTTAKLQDGVIAATEITPVREPGCTVFVHYNGPTDQLSGMCAGMATLDPGASPHPPHRHPEEEILIVAEGSGIIECDGKVTQVGPGAMMYCAGNTLHGITNTGSTQMTFYWSKWLAQGIPA
jgi:quercetin dioxygenase-like cupin family protein